LENEKNTFDGFNLKFHQSILVSNVSRFYVNQNGEVLEVKENNRDFVIGPIEWSPNSNQLLAFASSNFKGPEIADVYNFNSQNFSFYLKNSDETRENEMHMLNFYNPLK